MAKLIIEGPTRLEGKIKVAGSKNAALPIIAACLLSEKPVYLKNVPDISDVWVMTDILRQLGADVAYEDGILNITARRVSASTVERSLTARMRASVLIMGAAIGRLHKIKIAEPGGDIIGARPLDTHLHAFKALGIKISHKDGLVALSGSPKACRVVLDDLSVTATENIIMASVLADGTTELRMAATEPHIVDLCNFLNHLGAKISGIGSHVLLIKGVKKLHGGEWSISPDQLEAGTLAIAAAATDGEVTIEDFVASDHDALLTKFAQIGVNFKLTGEHTIQIKPRRQPLRAVNVKVQPYPNFPSDLQAPLAVLLTQARGTSEIFETLYEGRLQYLYELQRMGAHVAIKDTHTGTISGPTPLFSAELISFDIRAGATILIAAMVAEGRTVIDRVEHIDRGYENFDARLRLLGANMYREAAAVLT